MRPTIFRTPGLGNQTWIIPADLDLVVLVFTILIALSIWFLAAGIWTLNPAKKKRRLLLFVITIVPALWLAATHSST